jgi:hypothetical protein
VGGQEDCLGAPGSREVAAHWFSLIVPVAA